MENEEVAKLVSLEYLTDDIPGITRKKDNDQFIYYDPDSKLITDETELKRIKSLAIPPAYTNVWISPFANSHLQATGRDSKNRKQYRYHSRWREIRQENKFVALIPFGKSLPEIRKHVEEELNKPLKIDKNQIICAMIYLLDNHFIRIGNIAYEKQNKSYGVTTLRKKHLKLTHSQAVLEFIGKSAKPWHVVLRNKKILRILKKCEAIPGYRLFKYLDEDNNSVEVSSQDINNYLQGLTNFSFTAKDFRTWGACRETLYRLTQISYAEHETSQATLKTIVAEVAEILGHTPKICLDCYIYPEIINKWKEMQIEPWLKRRAHLAEDKDKLLLHWLESYVKE